MESIIYKTAQCLADILGYGTISHIEEKSVAKNLASIHAKNMGKHGEMSI